MRIKEYFKQRWYFFAVFFVLAAFWGLVGWASDLISNDNYIYILQGTIMAVVVFITIDYLKLKTRIIKMYEFIESNCSLDFIGNYPLDIKYAEKIKKNVDEHNKYKEYTETEHSCELEFITKWVHDVKVPISAAKLITESMESKEGEHIQMQLNYIDQNIQKILYHMKSKNFHDDYRIKETRIKHIVSHALKDYAIFFSYKSISLKMHLDDCIVYTDDKWSIYIVSQLISNAVKYTDNHGKIIICVKKENDDVLLSVKNTGYGIEEKNIKNIFKRGYSGYSTRKEKSTGYGLYLAKKLSEKMGHVLSAKSKQGEYAEFILRYKNDPEITHYKNVRYDA